MLVEPARRHVTSVGALVVPELAAASAPARSHLCILASTTVTFTDLPNIPSPGPAPGPFPGTSQVFLRSHPFRRARLLHA
jgi:hypothetical protein